MPLDAIMISALSKELNDRLHDMRVDKIQQPEKDVFILNLRARGDNAKLLISSGVGSARVHLTAISRENPQRPPMFCMLLRKYLTNAKIHSVTQPPYERLLDIEMDCIGDMGEPEKKHIIVEMIGKHSNIILCDDEMRIIDCLRKVDGEMSEKRPVLPGMFYNLPPKQEKVDPFSVTAEMLIRMYNNAPQGKVLCDWLLENFSAMPPLFCRELVFRMSGGTDERIGQIAPEVFIECFVSFVELLQNSTPSPVLLNDGVKNLDIACIPILQYGNAVKNQVRESFSALLDTFYTSKEQDERLKQRSQTLVKTVRSLRDRAARKLAIQTEELKATSGRERMRELGDILKANLHLMEKGMTELHALDFYSVDSSEAVIQLDAKLTPQQNAAKYYKAYSKAKNAESILKVQTEATKTEIEYLESVIEEFGRVSGERDISEIREELIAGAYIKKEKSTSKKQKTPESPLLRFKSSSGVEILAGKNNMQNDRLTFRTALKSDIWLHTQKIHGAHVVITKPYGEIDDQTLFEAAMIAAYYSKAKQGVNIPVDYTQVKNVKKPAHAKPGMVIYWDQRTLFVTPDEAFTAALKV